MLAKSQRPVSASPKRCRAPLAFLNSIGLATDGSYLISIEPLIARFIEDEGLQCLSLIRAAPVVNCHTAFYGGACD